MSESRWSAPNARTGITVPIRTRKMIRIALRCRSSVRLVEPIPFTKKPDRAQKDVRNVVAVPSKPTFWNKVTKFIREVRSEMRKVSWPNRQELVTYTIVVIVTVIIVAIFTGLVDVIVSGLLRLLGRLGG